VLLAHKTTRLATTYRDDEFDLSATGVGIVDEAEILGAHRVAAGDVLVGLASSGLHANGYGMIRGALQRPGGMARLNTLIDHRTFREILLTPTRLYAPAVLQLIDSCRVHAFAHVTGGGILGSLGPVLPAGTDAVVRRDRWTPPAVFEHIAEQNRASVDEMERYFNMGVGMVAVVPPEEVARAIDCLTAAGHEAWEIGEVVAGDHRVRMTGQYWS
jgi:phosphoribosylformylglycinamidine cyclo-ligase